MAAARELDVYKLSEIPTGTPSLVQHTTGFASGAGLSLTGTIAGNLMVAMTSIREDQAPTETTGGWTLVASVINNLGNFVRRGATYVKVSPGGTVQYAQDGPLNSKRTTLMEWEGSYGGVFAATDGVAATTNLDCGGSVNVTSGDVAIVGLGTIGFSDQDTDVGVAADANVVELHDGTAVSPKHWVGYLPVAGASGSYVVGGTIASSKTYCGVTIVVAAPGVGDEGGDAFEFLGTLESAFDVEFRDELDGHGSGRFSICRYDDPEAGTPNPECSIAMLGDGIDVTRLIKVRLGAEIVGAFWLETGDFTILSEQEKGAEILTFAGRGALAYLDRGMMIDRSFITGGHNPYDQLWRLFDAGTPTTVTPGGLLNRVIAEFTHAGREFEGVASAPIPLLTRVFDYDDDSTGAPWTTTDASAKLQVSVGTRGLAVLGVLLGTGVLTVRMAHDLVLGAYNRENWGTDRTGAAFGAGVVRWKDAVNIRTLNRQIAARNRGTHALAQGDGDAYGHATLDPTTRPHWEVFVQGTGTDTAALDAIAVADLAQRLARSETVRFPVWAGDDEATGLYTPWTHYVPGDTCTIDTGDHDRDLSEFDGVIAAVSFADRPGAVALTLTDLDVWVEVGSTMSLRDVAGSALTGGSYGGGLTSTPGAGGAGHTHPPQVAAADQWKQPCDIGTTANITLSGEQTIDGVLSSASRVLAKDQSAAAGNGIYRSGSGAWTREADMSAPVLVPGALVAVIAGSANAGTVWRTTNATAPVIGTDAIDWEEFRPGADPETPIEHGNIGATETLDFSLGTAHRGTLDEDCAITVTGFTVDEQIECTFKVVQGGVGGFGITWDADVVFMGDDQPGQTAGDVTWYLLWSDEGDSTIYAAKAGGGSDLIIEDEGTPLATVATTLDFVGAGVTASGTGAEKTITIPGVTGAAVAATGAVGPILIADTPAGSPLVFDDLLQNDDGDDLLYQDIG